MIARIFWICVLLILLPDIYIYRRFLRQTSARWLKVLWWGQTLVMLAWAWLLSRMPGFIPDDVTPLYAFLLVMGVYLVPKFFFMIFRSLGHPFRRFTPGGRNWGGYAGVAFGAFLAYVTLYGSFRGFNELEVRRVDFYSADLPPAFDGYRIALWSDAHVGSYTSFRKPVLSAAVDSLNAMDADVVFFLGDLQNTGPGEIAEHVPVLSRLSSRGGVYSVLGNHDYSHYMGGTREEKMAAEALTRKAERDLGWHLLLNENVVLRHGTDSIALAGMEGNDGQGEDHGWGIYEKALSGIPDGMFTILLLHNPYFWRKYIVPFTKVPLTLSGHTHGGQVRVLGFSPTSLLYTEDDGLYEVNGLQLFVTHGLGALIPLRFGIPGEVVQLTLHKKPSTP